MAPPVHKIVVFNFIFFFIYNPKTSCIPPPIFIIIKLGLTFLINFKSFLSDKLLYHRSLNIKHTEVHDKIEGSCGFKYLLGVGLHIMT